MPRDLRHQQSLRDFDLPENAGRCCQSTNTRSILPNASRTSSIADNSIPRARIAPRFCRCRVISAGVVESVTLATESLISLQKKLLRTNNRSPNCRQPIPASPPVKPLRLQRSVRIRHHIPDAKISIKLIECRRSKRTIRRSTQRNTAIETLHQGNSRAKRRFRSVRKIIQRRRASTGMRSENPRLFIQRSTRAPILKNQRRNCTESLAKKPNDLCRPPASTNAVMRELLKVVSAL